MRFYESDRESISMQGYIIENQSCNDPDKRPSKKIMRRYLINREKQLLHWYLLEQYFLGNIEIKDKDNVQSE